MGKRQDGHERRLPSQSIVTPEIDGAIRPYALFAHYVGKDDLEYVAAMPERLGSFVQTVNTT